MSPKDAAATRTFMLTRSEPATYATAASMPPSTSMCGSDWPRRRPNAVRPTTWDHSRATIVACRRRQMCSGRSCPFGSQFRMRSTCLASRDESAWTPACSPRRRSSGSLKGVAHASTPASIVGAASGATAPAGATAHGAPSL